MPVEGEYYLSTNEHRIHGKIAQEASAKIRTTLFFADPPPQPLGGADDELGTPPIGAPRSACELPSPIFLDPRGFARESEA
jgi:hypothetical protein